jgi:hypothetical protein
MLLAFLAGLLLTVGGLVAPLLFAILDDRALAGQLAGVIFHVTNLVVVGLVALLLIFGRGQRLGARVLGVQMAPALLLGLSEWGLHPLIVAEKVMHGAQTSRFALLHGTSGGLYAMATVAAVAALVRELRAGGAVNPAG